MGGNGEEQVLQLAQGGEHALAQHMKHALVAGRACVVLCCTGAAQPGPGLQVNFDLKLRNDAVKFQERSKQPEDNVP
jgi:hypothetical protein